MKARTWIVALALIAHPLAAERGRIVGIIDADTFRVDIGGRKEIVRLAGIDAPDPERPLKVAEFYGQEALLFAAELVKGSPVVELVVDPKAPDSDRGILVRNARLPDGKDLTLELLRGGYAAVSGNSYRFEELRQIERQAKREKRGMWDHGNFEAYRRYQLEWETSPRDFGPAADIPPITYAVEVVGPLSTVFVFTFNPN